MIASPASTGSQDRLPSRGARLARDLARERLDARERLGIRFGADVSALLDHAAALTVEADVLRDAVQGATWRVDVERREKRAKSRGKRVTG